MAQRKYDTDIAGTYGRHFFGNYYYAKVRLIANQFLELAKRYNDFLVLTLLMIFEFVDKIVVHATDRSSGQQGQEVNIYLKFIGKFNVPVLEPTSEGLAEQEKQRKLWERQRNEYLRCSREKKKAGGSREMNIYMLAVGLRHADRPPFS